MQPTIRAQAACEITGPTPTPSSIPSPTLRASVFSTSTGRSAFHEPPTEITTEPAMQRCPAAPNADEMMLSAVFPITASAR